MHSGAISRKKSLAILSTISIIQSGAILLASLTTERWISYIGYLIYSILYSFLITISSAEIAKHLIEDSFGLVFGINTLMALLVTTILTIIVIAESGFALNIFEQYIVFSIYHFILGCFYVTVFIYSILTNRIDNDDNNDIRENIEINDDDNNTR